MKTYGLIGKTLGHSFSKDFFIQKFEKEGLVDCQYKNFEIPEIEEFPEILKNNPNLAGLNVTIPYKTSIIKYLDEIDRDAKICGAVNTIRFSRSNGKTILTGYNTDTFGILKRSERF